MFGPKKSRLKNSRPTIPQLLNLVNIINFLYDVSKIDCV